MRLKTVRFRKRKAVSPKSFKCAVVAMVELHVKLFAGLCVAFCCNLSIIASEYMCRENGVYGQCTLYENCSTLQDTEFTNEMINKKHCRNSGLIGPVVCCPRKRRQQFKSRKTSTSSTTTTTTTTTTERPTLRKWWPKRYVMNRETNNADLKNFHPDGLALLNKPNCGRIGDDRLANGISAVQGEFPWMAMLLNAWRQPICGGSVITERFVLTAAHCINDDLRLVRLGEHKISTIEDCVHTSHICQRHVDFNIDPEQKPIIHPDYTSLNYYKDIALIKLDRDIDFKLYLNIAPICLPTKPAEYDVSPDDKLTLSGWGLQNNDRYVDELQKGDLKLKPLNICQKVYPRLRIDKSKLCIQAGTNNTVSCYGDSGGPLFRKTAYQNGRYTRKHYTQIGLVSLGYGKECGDLTSVPFMYENITDSMIWITHALYKAQFEHGNEVRSFFNSRFRRN